ncbi:hypothetical protein ACPW96_19350 [Micromonospora sp. DT81.3]|uniref:hypothetical protein n=1 Tax=Micromonospora sp. DT81.3 TaxID=3416523 RepID=UPI003CEE07D2
MTTVDRSTERESGRQRRNADRDKLAVIDKQGAWNPRGGEQYVHSGLSDISVDPRVVDTSADQGTLEIVEKTATFRVHAAARPEPIDSDLVFDFIADLVKTAKSKIPEQNDVVIAGAGRLELHVPGAEVESIPLDDYDQQEPQG